MGYESQDSPSSSDHKSPLRRRAVKRDPCTGKWSNDVQDQNAECDLPISGSGHDELDCILNSDDSGAIKASPVTYWYGVETPLESTNSFLSDLETKIFNYAATHMSWCIGGDGTDNNRRLITLDTPQVTAARQLGIVGINASPKDVETEEVCPYELINATANTCHVIHGQLTIVAREGDDLNFTIFTIHEAVGNTMAQDHLLGPDLPDVVKVIYLGDGEPKSNNTSRGGIVTPTVAAEEEDDDDFDGLALFLSFSSLAALLLLLAFWRKRRNVVTKSNSAIVVAGAAGAAGAAGDGTFHHGKYHYTRDGERYFENSCAPCQETLESLRRNRGLASIDELTVLDDDLLMAADSKDLGGKHHGMNVHVCLSATCQECAMNRRAVSFLPVGMDGARGTTPAVMPVAEDEASI